MRTERLPPPSSSFLKDELQSKEGDTPTLRKTLLATRLETAGYRAAARALRCCGKRDNPGASRLWCRRRYCPTCRRRRQQEALRRHTPALRAGFLQGAEAVFLTLNPPKGKGDVSQRINHLSDQLKRLRNRVAWKRPLDGFATGLQGLFAFEIGKQGHVHLHVLLWGVEPGRPQAAGEWLRQLWLDLNPKALESLQTVVRVEQDWPAFEAALWYVTKGSEVNPTWPEPMLLEGVEALSSGKHHLITCGLRRKPAARQEKAA